MIGEPLVLRHHTQHDAHSGQGVHGGGYVLLSFDLVALAPDVVQQHIEHGHGHRGDPLAQTQRHSVVFQTGGAQCQCAGHQMEGIARAQHNGHQAEQAELGASLAAANHADAHREHGDQIEDIENGFNNSSHTFFSFICFDCSFLIL